MRLPSTTTLKYAAENLGNRSSAEAERRQGEDKAYFGFYFRGSYFHPTLSREETLKLFYLFSEVLQDWKAE